MRQSVIPTYPRGHKPAGGTVPRKPRGRPEEAIQAGTINYLTGHGYIVHQTTVRVRQAVCAREDGGCGRRFYPKGGDAQYGVTPGTPDLFITSPTWPPGIWVGLECKSTTGRPTDAQKALLDTKRTAIFRSPQEALELVHRFEAVLFPRSAAPARFGAHRTPLQPTESES